MKDSHRANTLLVELLIVILFFMLAATTIVELFATARQKSRTATIRTEAVMLAQNMADELYLSEDPDSVLNAYAFKQEENGWVFDKDSYQINVTKEEDKLTNGTLRKMEISVSADDQVLFTLPCDKYMAEGATP